MQKVLVIGGTGLTGKEIVRALEEDGGFDLTCLIRPSSAQKPSVKSLAARGIALIPCDLENDPIPTIAHVLKGYDTILSAIGFQSKQTELKLVDAIALAGTKRFVPCSWSIPCPPGNIMLLRDEKEAVLQRIWHHHIPYTIVDVGYWYQISVPRVPSGKVDYIMVLPANERFGDGELENLLTDKRDIGGFVARVLKDPRTVNQRVVCWGERLSQNEVFKVVEEVSGEKTPHEALVAKRDQAREAFKADPGQILNRIMQSTFEYNVSKYVRGDNTLGNAKYLGYLDARELYPDFEPLSFKDFVKQVLDGKGEKLDLGDIDPDVAKTMKE
ncbi:isoflavone reductase family protein [Periconia macrospinosa]|uniref:Isoflavone reductase family protein n=1 Tax=Periconia macrospinosa TaxID=97972 RepID=A0A2V1E033_9PLEO|nr:isoflavone reductase family protein [Periconia macrospinosa]